MTLLLKFCIEAKDTQPFVSTKSTYTMRELPIIVQQLNKLNLMQSGSFNKTQSI